MTTNSLKTRVARILEALPPGVSVVAAVKTRTPEEVAEVLDAGISAVGHNYVQEAEPMIRILGGRARWHLIGHLQRNKARRAVELFDVIETIDSWRIAEAVDKRCSELGKVMPVLVEINSGKESSKTGVVPQEVEELVKRIANLKHIRLEGLMTMGPRFGDPEDARPYFRLTRGIFDKLKEADIPGIRMRTLSMGMSNSYRVAIEEGANMIRLGTVLFGQRSK